MAFLHPADGFLCEKLPSVNEPRQQDVRADIGSEHEVDAFRRGKIWVCEMNILKKLTVLRHSFARWTVLIRNVPDCSITA